METAAKAELISRIKSWFDEEFIQSHYRNIRKLASLKEFNVNPFTWPYLATFLGDKDESVALARALILPRALGSSISTSFGTQIQQMVTKNFDNVMGSQIPGIDFEFIDKIDNRKKYCQLKAGPNVVNNDDVKPIKENSRRLETSQEPTTSKSTSTTMSLLFSMAREVRSTTQSKRLASTTQFSLEPNFGTDLPAT